MPQISGCIFQWITRALAHEIAEVCTNPVDDKEAFVDPNPDDQDKNEIADFCACKSDKVNGVTVEGYWSNLDGCCVIPKGDGTQITFELCPPDDR